MKKRKPTYLNDKGYRIPSPFHQNVSVTVTGTTLPTHMITKTFAMKECSKCKGIFRAELKECPRCKRLNTYKREYNKPYMRAKRDPDNPKYDERYKTREF
jgi:phage FluMu protein Com